ncbi:MAG TPA: hypothetical protein VGM67_04915 [Gemmatimonadaceae bacterium]|jgi:hypothetical protein
MHWDMINAVATAAVTAMTPAVAVAWRFARRRSERRNNQGECASCGLAWSEIGIAPVEYQVHGAHVCAPCAHRLRRRTAIAFGSLSLATALASAAALPHLVAYARPPYNWPLWALAWTALPPFALAAATTLAFRRMKRDNHIGPPGSPDRSTSLLGEGSLPDVPRPRRARVDDSQDKFLPHAT